MQVYGSVTQIVPDVGVLNEFTEVDLVPSLPLKDEDGYTSDIITAQAVYAASPLPGASQPS